MTNYDEYYAHISVFDIYASFLLLLPFILILSFWSYVGVKNKSKVEKIRRYKKTLILVLLIFLVFIILQLCAFSFIKSEIKNNKQIKLEGIVDSLVVRNSGFNFRIGDTYFNVSEHHSFCLRDLDYLIEGNKVEIEYVELKFLLNRKCILRLKDIN